MWNSQANVYAVMNIISAVWTLIPVLYEESGTIQVRGGTVYRAFSCCVVCSLDSRLREDSDL